MATAGILYFYHRLNIMVILQQFDLARVLVQAAEITVKDIAYKLGKALRWQLLRIDLAQYQASSNQPASVISDVTKRAKTCLTSLETKHGKMKCGTLMIVLLLTVVKDLTVTVLLLFQKYLYN